MFCYSQNIERRYRIFNKNLCIITKTKYYTKIKLLHIIKFTLYKFGVFSLKKLKRIIHQNKKIILYIDHALGGGTAVYSDKKIKELSENNDVFICQYDNIIKKYVLSNDDMGICVIVKKFADILYIPFSHVIVNSIVNYDAPFDVLKSVAKEKEKNKNLKIDYMLHDFYCICQYFNLMNHDKKICVENNIVKCTKCRKDINTWQTEWAKFLEKTPDNIIVFSQSSKKILSSVYPNAKSKIKVIPHVVSWPEKVKIEKHDDINIGVFGNVYTIKGAEIIDEMARVLPKGVNIIIIGEYGLPKPKTSQFICTGQYDIKSLPDIVKKHQIDIAFISSIVPETFSFTTSECMNMGLPVACFNIGAPVERVSKYKYGLIISKIEPKTALKELVNFVENIRRGENK